MGILQRLFKKPEDPEEGCAVIVVAAGSATRMEGIDKIMTPLGGTPLILHTLAPFQASPLVEEIVIVTQEDKMVEIGTLCSRNGFDKVKRIVKGGVTRTDSVWAGLKEVSKSAGYLAIQDGARPFVTREIIEETIQTAKARSAAAPAIPVKDTIKRAEDGVVTETLDRASLFAMSSRSEGFPFVLLEAQSCALPIVAYDVRVGPGFLVHDGIDGFLVREGDRQGYEDRLVELMEDPARRAEMGQAAMANAALFSREKIAEKWYTVIG